MKNWWKILSVFLMLYTLIAGFLIPLKPGIYDFNPRKITIGESSPIAILINTYNTRLDEANENNVYLKTPADNLLKASRLEVKSSNEVIAHFEIPGLIKDFNTKEESLTLIVDNELDGYSFYPDAINVIIGNTDPLLENEYSSLNEIKEVEKFAFPYRLILYETIRNTFFHVAIWFSMFILLIYSCYHSVRYLITKDLDSDSRSSSLTTVALFFGIAGILTGSMWARYTWGTFWTTDIKLNMSATALLVYFAYWFLRSSISDIDTRARIAAVYNIFAFVCLMILVMVIPRFTDSLHPGNGGNPALGGEDLDNTLRTIFYPAIIGYTLLGLWMAQLQYRYSLIKDRALGY